MSTNPKQEYNTFIRANLPVGMTYDSTRNRYVVNNKYRFPTYLQAKWYLDYITKFGYSAGNPVLFIPSGSDSLIDANGDTFKVIEVVLPIPANAIAQRDGDYILDRSGNYIEVRA